MQILDLPAAIPVGSMERVMAVREEQIVTFGHTPQEDAALPVNYLPEQARKYLTDAKDEIMRHAPGWQDRASRKLARAGALVLAAMDRLELEFSHDGE